MRLWDYIVGVGKPLSVGEYLLKAGIRGRPGLVRKQIIDKRGRKNTKWVNLEEPSPAKKTSPKFALSSEEKKRRQAMYQASFKDSDVIVEAKGIMASNLTPVAKEAMLDRVSREEAVYKEPTEEEVKLMAEFRSHLEDARKEEAGKKKADVAFSPVLGEKPGRYLKEITIGGEKRDLTEAWIEKLFTSDGHVMDVYKLAKKEEEEKHGKASLAEVLASFQEEWKGKGGKEQIPVLNALARSSRSTKKKVYRGMHFKKGEVDILGSHSVLEAMRKKGTLISFDKVSSFFFNKKKKRGDGGAVEQKYTPLRRDLRASSFTGDEQTAVEFANDPFSHMLESYKGRATRVMLEVVAQGGKNVVGLDMPSQKWQAETILGGGEYKVKEVRREEDSKYRGGQALRVVLEQQQ